jgi:hypothetical protein
MAGAVRFFSRAEPMVRITLALARIAMQLSGGNVGIGVNPPSQRLHVVGNSFLDGNIGIGTNPSGFRADVAGRARFRQDVGFVVVQIPPVSGCFRIRQT